MSWAPYENGATVGGQGSEEGTVLKDEEHELGARVTLEETPNRAYSHAITCGIYGWMVQTCFFGNLAEAKSAFDELKFAVEGVLALIPDATDPDREAFNRAVESTRRLVDRF